MLVVARVVGRLRSRWCRGGRARGSAPHDSTKENSRNELARIKDARIYRRRERIMPASPRDAQEKSSLDASVPFLTAPAKENDGAKLFPYNSRIVRLKDEGPVSSLLGFET